MLYYLVKTFSSSDLCACSTIISYNTERVNRKLENGVSNLIAKLLEKVEELDVKPLLVLEQRNKEGV